ncbi:hypothetical protein [Lysobacter enzymogenes]|uniref:hypothetical protein n=1 Tax=Lysobacter enzymogenes TaxID=69 RepID=UPI001A966671|nr:hypothetical protein [Lysobacter enzymogenes]QQP96100.1 hypothetical protein JHW38_23285 [Lysobacter enzymogenes]
MRKILQAAMLTTAFFAAAASAQTAPTGARSADEPAAQVDAPAAAQADPAAAQRNDPRCLTQTGSRVQARGKNACAGYGRSYDRKDLERTGETDVGQALRKLDPRLR